MNRSHYTNTRRWLENRFARTDASGVYIGHMPIYGHRTGPTETGRLPRLARALQVLQTLDRTEFRSFLDVGCAEGYLAWVVRRVFGAEVVGCDLSVEACRRAGELFGVDAVACDAERLPFPDDAFDVVISSETIEHVEHPVNVLLEMQRVARRAVVLTTEEVAFDFEAIARWLAQRCGYPHSERNQFHPDDLRAVFGEAVELWTQFTGDRPAEPLADADARAWVLSSTPERPGLRGAGVVAVSWIDPAARRAPELGREALCDAVFAAHVPPRALARRERAIPRPSLLGQIACPVDRTPLRLHGTTLVSPGGRRYPVLDGGIAALHAREIAPVPEPDLDGAIADTARRDAVRALHDRLFMPDPTGRTEWRFRDAEARRGWRVGDDLTSRSGDGPGWTLRSTGNDPDVVGPTMAFGTDEVDAFEVEMRIFNPAFDREAGTGQIFWMCDEDVTFREQASVKFPVLNDGAIHSYLVDPRTDGGWPTGGDLLCIRLDPVDGPCEVDLVAVRIRHRS